MLDARAGRCHLSRDPDYRRGYELGMMLVERDNARYMQPADA
jgi:hypothetical protein